jgi:TRAP transporter TAXI family solute receptor
MNADRKEGTMLFRAILPTVTALGLLTQLASVSAQQPIAIATPKAGSIYNSTAAAMGKVLTDKAGLKMTIQAMGGSSQYLPIIDAGELPFGIANVYETSLGVTGQDYFKGRPTKNIRTVAILYPLRHTVFVKKDSSYKTLKDLKGARAPVGFASQKILTAVTDAVFATVGLSLDKDFKGVNTANIISQANLFKEGRTDFFVFALGAGKVKEVDAAVGGVRALPAPHSDAALAAARKVVPVVYYRQEKPSPANTGILEPVWLISYGVNLFASTKTPDDVVYKVTKGIHDHAKEMGGIFPPLRLLDINAMAQPVHGVEYHPGAIKYYKEQGQWPPKSL